jgi:hypothetical protein
MWDSPEQVTALLLAGSGARLSDAA